MINFDANGMSMVTDMIHMLQCVISQANSEHPGTNISPTLAKVIVEYLDCFDLNCRRISLTRSLERIEQIRAPLTGQGTDKHDAVWSELHGLQSTIWTELKERKFAYIPESKQEFFEQENLFGTAVSDKFPLAKSDIKDAGNCLAAGLHTAAVFHLMRVAEQGMRALAIHLKVKIIQGKRVKVCPHCKIPISSGAKAKAKTIPLEYAMWDETLKALHAKIGKIKQSSKGQRRTADSEFYQGLVIELEAFKDLWRNEVMHCRGAYDSHQAMRAMVHVREFMQRLVTRVSENYAGSAMTKEQSLGRVGHGATP
jgi:hypothetical protein